MAMAITFDTLKFVRKLTDAGIPQKQAEAQAEAFKEAHEENLDSLATKQDVSALKRDITELRAELKTDIADLKIDLIKWVLGIVFAATAAQAAIVKFFH